MTTAPRRALGQASACAAVAAVVVAGLGGWATELGPWYRALRQPAWQPPDTWFGPAWTLIYTLTAAAGVRAWLGAREPRQRHALLLAFGLNASLNVLWSWLFFRLRRPDWALAEVVLLWLSIIVLMVVCGRTSSAAVWLLVPYLAWVAFAASLNLGVVQLNAPF